MHLPTSHCGGITAPATEAATATTSSAAAAASDNDSPHCQKNVVTLSDFLASLAEEALLKKSQQRRQEQQQLQGLSNDSSSSLMESLTLSDVSWSEDSLSSCRCRSGLESSFSSSSTLTTNTLTTSSSSLSSSSTSKNIDVSLEKENNFSEQQQQQQRHYYHQVQEQEKRYDNEDCNDEEEQSIRNDFEVCRSDIKYGRSSNTIPTTSAKAPPPTTPNEKPFVSFGFVHIREYKIIVGDHPYCEEGLPLSLGWQYNVHAPVCVNVHQEEKRIMQTSRQKKQRSNKMIDFVDEFEPLTPRQRFQKLRKVAGYTERYLNYKEVSRIIEIS